MILIDGHPTSAKCNTCCRSFKIHTSKLENVARGLVFIAIITAIVVIILGSTCVEKLKSRSMSTKKIGYRLESLGRYFSVKKTDEITIEPKTTRRMDAIIEPYEYDIVVAKKVLSKPSQLASQISHLDAQDVVECFIVTRMAKLEDVASNTDDDSDSEEIHRILDNSKAFAHSDATKQIAFASIDAETSDTLSGSVMIQKSALAFRHRPRVSFASSQDHISSASPGNEGGHHKYFELTLEYGPHRSDVNGTTESVPHVHHMKNASHSSSGRRVSWDNKSRLYYSTQISDEWKDAYYMAQITGVVFEKIIQRAVQYTHKWPRYQPFDVVSKPSGNVILKSSGPDDFVWNMFHDLSEFYVDIDPLLLPPRHSIQIYVADSSEKVSNGSESWNETMSGEISQNSNAQNTNVEEVTIHSDGENIAAFYENLIKCVNVIKSGNYSLYESPSTPAPIFLANATSVVPLEAPSMELSHSISDDLDYIQNQKTLSSLRVSTNASSSFQSSGRKTGYSSSLMQSEDDEVTFAMISKTEALLSGDGILMTSAFSSCFSNPRYGIRAREDEMRYDQTIGYLYVDGVIFFRLNLTSPYLGMKTSWGTVPPPPVRPVGSGEAIDWAIFTLILMGALSGIITMVYQWEKSPLRVKKGGGFPHSALFLSAESIPSSMGGEGRLKISTVSYCDQLELVSPKKVGLKKQKLPGTIIPENVLPSKIKSNYAKLNHPSTLELEMETSDILSTSSAKISMLSKKQVKESTTNPQYKFSIDNEMAIIV